tara:strand:- start:1524 stop:1880 length:357 start_codon:yes stop_codon:yes gene_type:complete
MERYIKKNTDMRYASPDGIRPNPDVIRRARKNFNRKNTPRAPSPSQLPMPSQRLLTRKKSRSKSPGPVVIQGKNRKWTIKAKKSSRPRTSSATRRRGRGRKKHRRNPRTHRPSRNHKP